jgi:hypothetical protein
MAFKSARWQPIAVVLSAANLVGVGFAAGGGEGLHAGVHAVLALAFGLWAQRLMQRPLEIPPDERLDALEVEVGDLRRELGEAQERLDFAERVLVRSQEGRRLGPES